MIKLGDKVKCRYTGFTGVAVAKTEFINGCVQYEVAPKAGKDNKLPEPAGIDEESLIIVKTGKSNKPKPTGGPNSISKPRRGW